ncbi:MAG TPA: hypothetical protein VNN62_03440 [Methylomirabilota bacterium]|jgi:hypothetical protein|nr:hypothetical protein [Methylomirabilota bacterium]
MRQTRMTVLTHTVLPLPVEAVTAPARLVTSQLPHSSPLQTVTKRGVLLGLLLGPLAAVVVTSGVGSPLVSLAYGVNWAAAFAIAGGWAAAMFFAGLEGCCGNV